MRKGNHATSSVVPALAICLFSGIIAAAQKVAEPSRPGGEQRSVAIRASVLDPLGRFYPTLEKESFRVYDNNEEQTIFDFGLQSEPVSVGIVWDISGSMKDENTLRVKYAINYLLRSLSPKDECFMIAFNQNIFPIALDTDKSYVQQEDELMKKTKGEATFFL